MSFGKDLANFTKKTEKAGEMVFRGSAFEILSAIIKRTPVDTGRLRGNWFTSLNQAVKSISVSRSASNSISNASGQTKKAKLSDTIYMMNNLPYAAIIENGSSKQAPAGMLRVTITEWKRLVNAKARQAR